MGPGGLVAGFLQVCGVRCAIFTTIISEAVRADVEVYRPFSSVKWTMSKRPLCTGVYRHAKR